MGSTITDSKDCDSCSIPDPLNTSTSLMNKRTWEEAVENSQKGVTGRKSTCCATHLSPLTEAKKTYQNIVEDCIHWDNRQGQELDFSFE